MWCEWWPWPDEWSEFPETCAVWRRPWSYGIVQCSYKAKLDRVKKASRILCISTLHGNHNRIGGILMHFFVCDIPLYIVRAQQEGFYLWRGWYLMSEMEMCMQKREKIIIKNFMYRLPLSLMTFLVSAHNTIPAAPPSSSWSCSHRAPATLAWQIRSRWNWWWCDTSRFMLSEKMIMTMMMMIMNQ